MEIERKWLMDTSSLPFSLADCDREEIMQEYISFSPTIRIRKLTYISADGAVHDPEYILTVKGKSLTGLSREEYELSLSSDDYDRLSLKKEGRTIAKTRYLKNIDGYKYEMDVFSGDLSGLSYLEIEFPSEEEALNYPAPSWAYREVTGVRGFSNADLAKKGMPSL